LLPFGLTIASGSGRFHPGFTPASAKDIGENGENLHVGGIICYAKQRSDIETHPGRGFIGKTWADDKAMRRIPARIFDGKVCVLHFHPRFQTLVRKEDRHLDALREAQFATAVAGGFILKKGVESPLDIFGDLLREQQTELVGIGLIRSPTFFFPEN
jgi:hypothetical protein